MRGMPLLPWCRRLYSAVLLWSLVRPRRRAGVVALFFVPYGAWSSLGVVNRSAEWREALLF